MHEMSIIEALVEAVHGELRAHPGAHVETVRVRVGALRQVVPETLTFCFTAATRDTALAGANLEIEAVPARARCGVCHAEFAVAENWFACPDCHAAGGELLAGRELDLMSIALEEAGVG